MVRHVGGRAGKVRFAACLAGAFGALSTRPVTAAVAKLQAVAETSIGVTDNAQSAPDVPLPGGASRSAGAFIVMRPGLALGVTAQRSVQRLAYTFDYDLFFARSTTSSTSNRLEYRGFFDLSPRINAIVGAAATESDSYAALTLAPPASGLLPILPSGTSKLLTVDADETFNFELSVGWRAWEGLGVVYGTPLFGTEAPTTLSPNAKLGIEYAWTGDALGLEGRGSYTVVRNGVQPNGVPVPLNQQLIVGGVGLYRHDLGRYLTTGFEGGALHVTQLTTHESHVYPTAAAHLAYADVIGDAQLSAAHTLTTNVLLGQTLLANEVRLRGGVPLDKKGEFSLAASSGYQFGQLLDQSLPSPVHVSVLTVDVTFGWQLNPWLLVGARAQHIDQHSDARSVTLPVTFSQNSVMLGAALHFPPDLTMPGAYRAPRRVDRTDELRGTPKAEGEEIPAPTGRAR